MVPDDQIGYEGRGDLHATDRHQHVEVVKLVQSPLIGLFGPYYLLGQQAEHQPQGADSHKEHEARKNPSPVLLKGGLLATTPSFMPFSGLRSRCFMVFQAISAAKPCKTQLFGDVPHQFRSETRVSSSFFS